VEEHVLLPHADHWEEFTELQREGDLGGGLFLAEEAHELDEHLADLGVQGDHGFVFGAAVEGEFVEDFVEFLEGLLVADFGVVEIELFDVAEDADQATKHLNLQKRLLLKLLRLPRNLLRQLINQIRNGLQPEGILQILQLHLRKQHKQFNLIPHLAMMHHPTYNQFSYS
jgi:hypothetical protein